MRGTALLLLCAIALAQAAQPQLTINGNVCNCNAGEAASVCSQNGSDNELIVHENCNQFYKCTHGQPIPYFCPDTTLYNPLAERCDWPYNVQCGDRPIVAPPSGGAETEDCSEEDSNNGGGDNGGSDNGNGGTCNCNPEEAPALCAAGGSNGVLVAHQNCNQFYKCDHGIPVVFNCPSGLLYNPYTEQCDWPDKVDCGDRPIVEIEGGGDNGGDVDCGGSGDGNGDSGSGGGSGDNGGGDNGGGDNGGGDNGGTCNCNPGEAPGLCAADGSDGVLVAHENCNQFYKCAHGLPVTVSCPPGLVYNPYIECCDWPSNVDCGDKPIVEIDGGGNGESGGDSGSGGGNGDNGGGSGGNSNEDNGTCNCNPEDAPGICAADGSDGTLVAHENCNQFYKCDHGTPVTITCPPGLVYNPYIECCDWPANVNCGDRPIVEVDGGGGNGDGGNGDGGNGDSGNGDGGNGNGDGGNGEGGGGGTCNCNPGEAPGLCAADGSDGVLVAHENCNQFYKCANGLPVALFCYNGLVYNPHTEQCDWPQNVDCGDKPIVEVDGGGGNGDGGNGDGGNGDGGNGDGGNGDGGNGEGGGGGTCNCNPGEAPGLCAADGSDGVLVAHENCNQFYKCANGLPVALFCYNGLVYNPHTEQCDWPQNVDCGDKPIVEVDGGGGNGDGGNGDGGNGDGGNGDGGNGDGGNGEGGGGGTCNCNPGEAPGLCAADGSDGVLVAHENCNQFYKCANGLPVALFCYNGLVYNPHTEQCDWPQNVDCGDKPIVEVDGGGGNGDGGNGDGGNGDGGNGDGGNGDGGNGEGGGDGTCNCNPGEAPGLCAADGSDGVLVAHENCNQFYKCANGLPVALFCYNGLVYNPHTEQCDWPQNVDCGDKPIVEVGGGGGNGDGGNGDGGNGDGGNGDGGNGDGGNGEGAGGGTCNCNPGEAPGICGADGSDGVLVAHENCNQFYKCANGVPVALVCNENLLYNPYTEQCDWPENVDCGDRPIVEVDGGGGNGDGGNGDGGNGDGGNGDGGNGEGGGGGTCNCNPGEAPGICAADGSDGVLVAHENCNQFYKCANGVPVALVCNENLLYNPYTEQCDWPENVDCGDRPIVEVDGGGGNGDGGNGDGGNGDGGNGDGGNGDGGNGEGGGGGTCNCNPGEAPGICAADGSDGVLVAHENCNQFYKCANGVPVALVCNENLLYNPYTEQCDWPENVDCGDRPIVEVDGGGGNGDGGNGDGGNGDGGNGDGGNGEGGGGGTCNCNPGEAPGICAADGSDGVLVAHENCNQFYKCANGVPVALICNENLLYNPYTEQCDWPENVDCGDRPIVEVDGDGGNGDGGNGDGGNGDGGNGDGGNGDGGNGEGGGGGTCNCNPGEAPGICAADGSDGVLIAHENCNQFYKCANGVPVALVCNENLLYNPYTEQCDWPENVDCGDRPIVEVDGDGGNGDGGNGDGGNGDGGNGDGGNGDGGNGDGGNGEGGGGGTCNCNPGEAPGICAADGSDGVLIAHENCNQFYKCANGVPVALVCNENLLYNPYTEQCDWPQNVNCGDRPIVEVDGGGGGSDNGGTDNGGSDNGSGDNGGSDNGGSDNGGSDNGGGDNGSSCNCNPDEASGICAAAGSDGTLVAHENCNQFYQCAHGLPVCHFCSGILLYNPYTQRCDWPHLVDCGDRPIVDNDGESEEDGGSDNGGGDSGGGDNGGTCNCNPVEAPSICGAAGSEGTLVAHENCNQYYICAHGLPVGMFCSGNLLYNPYTERCDWPNLVECGDRPIVEVEGGGGDNGGGGEGDGGNNGDNCDPSQAPAICAADGSDGILIAHENCNQFYLCTHGVPSTMDCPSNLLYNPSIRDCDWPSNVDCGDRVIPEPESGGNDGPCACNAREAPSICAGSESSGKLIAHENCGQYYQCSEGVPVARSCPQSLFYEPHTKQCLWPAAVSCEGRFITSYSSLNKHVQARRGFF